MSVLAAAAYVAAVAAVFPAFVRDVYWNSDAAGAFVVAKLWGGHGTVTIPRFGWWTGLWWLLATRDLPDYADVWKATGYVFAVATAVVVGWATSRIAGRWAGITAGAATIVVGPAALESLVTVNFHSTTPFAATVLAAYLVILSRRRSWLLAFAVGVFAGVSAASDPLLWIAGLAPFAVAGGVLALFERRRDVAVRIAVVVAFAAATVVVTDRIMSGLGFHLIPVALQPAGRADVVPNFIRLGKSIALLFGANHFFPGVYPDPLLRYALTLIAFAAVAATLFVAVRLVVRRASTASPLLAAYASFWAVACVLLSLAFWLTNQGTGVGPGGGANYLLTMAPAAGVGVAILAMNSKAGRLAASIGIAIVGGINAATIAQDRVRDPAAAAYGPKIVRYLDRNGVRHGYAPYWDAQSVTWNSGTRVVAAPIQRCSSATTRLCKFPYFTINKWYDKRPGPSFLVIDQTQGLPPKPPASLGRPVKSRQIAPEIKVYIYRHDLAQHIRHPAG